jgi:hypothetical protein
VVPPAHDAPSSVHPVGDPEPEAVKPNDTERPGATVPFQDSFRNVWRWPELLRTAFQDEPTPVPAGRSKTTVHDVIADVPVLVIVYCPV